MLQQRGYHVIELSNGDKIQLRFCTWTFKRFCELNGNLSLNELVKIFVDRTITLSQVVSLILCAAEYVKISGKEDFAYTDLDASNWIDDLGGFGGQRLAGILVTAARSIVDTGETTEGKKKEGKRTDMGVVVGHGSRVEPETLGV